MSCIFESLFVSAFIIIIIIIIYLLKEDTVKIQFLALYKSICLFLLNR